MHPLRKVRCIACELAWATLMSTNQPYGSAPIFLVNVEERGIVVHRVLSGV